MAKALSCSVTFFPDFCVFQDFYSGRIKRIGRDRGGLYVLKKGPGDDQFAIKIKAVAIAGSDGQGRQWYMWLGNPFILTMQHVADL